MANTEVKFSLIVDDNGTVRSVFGGTQRELEALNQTSSRTADAMTSSFGRIYADATKLAAAIGATALAYRGMHEAAALVTGQINLADDMNDLSRTTGIAVEKLSAFRLGLETNGASMGSFAAGMRALSNNIAEGDTMLLKLLGTSKEALQMRDVTDVMLDLSDIISRMPDGWEKSAIATREFSRSGQELIPFLNEGRAGLENWRQEAVRFGLVITQDMASAADKFNDDMRRMKGATEGVAMAVGQELIKQISPLVKDLLTWAAANREVIAADVAGAIRSTASAIRDSAGEFRTYSDFLDRVGHAAKGGLIGGFGGQVAGVPFPVGFAGGAYLAWKADEWMDGRAQTATAPAAGDPFAFRPLPSHGVGGIDQIVPRIGGVPRGLFDDDDAIAKAKAAAEAAEAKEFNDVLRSRAAYQEAVTARQAESLDLAKKDLAVANDRFRLNRSDVDAWMQLVAAARGLDEAEQQALETKRAQLGRQLLLVDATDEWGGEVEKVRQQIEAVNDQLSRGPSHVKDLSKEIDSANGKAKAFGTEFGQSLTSVFDSLLASGGKFSFGDVIFDSLKRDSLQFFGSELPKIIGDGMQSLAGQFRNGPVGDLLGRLTGGGNLWGIGWQPNELSYATNPNGSVSAYDPSGNLVGTGTDAAAAAKAANPHGDAAAAALSFGIVLGLQGVANGFDAASEAKRKRATSSQASAAGRAGFLDTITFGIVPDNWAKGAPDWAFDLFFGPGLSEAFGMGAMTKNEIARAPIRDILVESQLARTQAVSDDDRVRGATVGSVMQLLDPKGTGSILPFESRGDRNQHEIRQLMADFAVSSQYDLPGAVAAANARTDSVRGTFGDQFSLLAYLTGNVSPGEQSAWMTGLSRRAGRLGLSDGMIQAENRRLAATAGVDLQGSLVGLNEARLQAANEDGIKTQEEYNRLVVESVKLFSVDVPNGLDVTKIAFDAMESTTRGNIINLETFNKSLERVGSLATGLQSTLTGGVSSGFGAAFGNVLNGGSLRRSDLSGALSTSITGGVTTMLTNQLTTQLTEGAAFKSWNADFFKALQAGNTAGVADALARVPSIVDEMAASAEKFVPVLELIRKQAEDIARKDPQTFYDTAEGYSTGLRNVQFSRLRPGQQRTQLQSRYDAIMAQYRTLSADGLTAAEAERIQGSLDPLLSDYQNTAGQFSGGARNQMLDNIERLYALGEQIFTEVGDNISFENIKGGTLTVDQIITRNTGGTASAGAGTTNNFIIQAGAETALTGEIDVVKLVALIARDPRVNRAIKSAASS